MSDAKKRVHFLYRTTNKVNGKYYIGVHTTWNLDDGYLGSGKHLTRSVKEHGRENFVCEVLKFFDTREEAYVAEAIEVSKYLGSVLCMNLHPGGNGGWSEAAKRLKWLLANDDEWNRRRKKNMSTTMKELGSIRWLKSCDWRGRTHTESTKHKISRMMAIKQAGQRNSQHGTVWINNGERAMKVKGDTLERYLTEGWTRGRKT